MFLWDETRYNADNRFARLKTENAKNKDKDKWEMWFQVRKMARTKQIRQVIENVSKAEDVTRVCKQAKK